MDFVARRLTALLSRSVFHDMTTSPTLFPCASEGTCGARAVGLDQRRPVYCAAKYNGLGGNFRDFSGFSDWRTLSFKAASAVLFADMSTTGGATVALFLLDQLCVTSSSPASCQDSSQGVSPKTLFSSRRRSTIRGTLIINEYERNLNCYVGLEDIYIYIWTLNKYNIKYLRMRAKLI